MPLYNKVEHEIEMREIDYAEQQISVALANGTITGFRARQIQQGWISGRTESGKPIWSGIEPARRRARMKLINTGQLVSDLRAAQVNLAKAESETDVKDGKKRLGKMWGRVRGASDPAYKPSGYNASVGYDPEKDGYSCTDADRERMRKATGRPLHV